MPRVVLSGVFSVISKWKDTVTVTHTLEVLTKRFI